MTPRRGLRYPELTSLLDTLFIVVFAALIQARGSTEREAERLAAAAEPAAEPEPPAGPPDAGVIARHEIHAATARIVGSIRNHELVLVVVSGEGHLASITRRWDERALPPEALAIKLLRDSQDPEVRVTYRGREALENRICAIVRRELAVTPDLARAVVVITADRPFAEMPYGLVTGMLEDAASCLDDANGLGIVVDPGKAIGP